MSTTTPGDTPTTPTTAAEIHAAAVAAATEACEALDLFDLARMASCGMPPANDRDGDTSEGADALDTARNVAAEAAAEHLAGLDPAEAVELCATPWDLVDAVSDPVWEGVDGSGTLIYTACYREAFAELDGWSEDPAAEFGTDGADMDKLAQLAVFSIMSRCADAVAERYAEAYAEAVDDLGGLPEDPVTCDECDATSVSGWGDAPTCLDCTPAEDVCETHQRTTDGPCPLCEDGDN